jgi:hypothetical protein
MTIARMLAGLGVLALGAGHAFGQPKGEADHRVVFEAGVASDRGLAPGSSRFGGTVALEVTPIEKWLELEAGVTILGTLDQRELSADLLFKKPWQLSRRAEFMAGIGPELSTRLAGAKHEISTAAEAVLDFMFWPTTNVGWYVEPSYSVSLGANAERRLGVSAGLLIGWP